MKTFVIGEKVGFLREQGIGIVKGFRSNNELIIEDETGFERYFHASDLIKIKSLDFDLGGAVPIKENYIPNKKQATIYIKEEPTFGAKSAKFWELDLHIEELIDSHRGMSNAEILQIQISEFRAFYRKALAHRITKIIIIHGVGEGVLKDEIRLFLSKKENLEYFDASYQEYGKGATEIRFNQSAFE
jgi:hypothetical protein